MMRRSLHNRPLRSSLGNRKMFQGGGMVPMGNPMANMQPMGILASSQPLVDAVANDAINPQGGTALSMADGGIAKFQNGGFYQHGTAWKPSSSPQVEVPIKVPSLTFAYEGDVPPSPEGPTVELIPTRLEDSISAPPSPFAKTHTSESIQLMEIETPSARVDRMFPAAAGPGGLTHEKRHPDAPSGVVPRGIAKAGSFFESALESVGFGLLTDIQSIIDVGFSAESDPESESYIPNLGIGERKTIAHLIARAPKALHQEIMDIGKSLVSQKDYKLPYYAENISDPEIAGRGGLAFNPLAQDIAQALHEKHERPGIDRVRAKQAAIKSSRALRFGQTEPITVAEALEQARPQDLPTEEWGFSNLEAMKEEHLAGLRDASDPSEVTEIIQNLQRSGLPPSYTDELLRVFRAEDEDLIEAQETQTAAAEAAAAAAEGMYPEQYPGSDALLTAETAVVGDADADETAVAAGQEIPLPVTKPAPDEIAAADDLDRIDYLGAGDPIRNIESAASQAQAEFRQADTQKKQGKAQTSLESYLEEFRKAVPDYEGKSESEKGWDIVKMGMAIAAGESEHAITNIAKGVMATIDNFTSDDKERRAYKRQIDLSAAKYGLQNVARDREELRADAKAGRQLYTTVFRVRPDKTFEYDGKTLTGGDTVILRVGEIQDGSVDLSNLETEASVLAGIELYNKRLKTQLDALQKTVTDPSKFEGPKKNYLENAAGVRTNIATQGYLKNSLAALNSTNVTGIKGASKDWILSISNALGMKEFSEEVFGELTTKAEYVDFTERATTKFIEGLISEGGKISDFERELARELSGAIGVGAFDGILTDPDILETKILSFIASLDADTDIRLKAMSLTERTWGTRYATIDPGRVSYGQMLKEAVGPLSSGRLSSQMIPGSVNWTDIISVDPESNAVVGVKPRDEW